jgi:hypothetical protein
LLLLDDPQSMLTKPVAFLRHINRQSEEAYTLLQLFMETNLINTGGRLSGGAGEMGDEQNL